MAHDPADRRTDRPHARDFRAGGRGVSRTRPAGRVEGAGRQRQPVAGLDPRRDAGAGGARAADPSAHLRRPHPDRKRAAAVRRRDHAGVAAGRRASGRRSKRQIDRDQPIEEALAAASAALSGPVVLRRRGAGAEAGAAAQAIVFVALEPTARWPCWSAPTAASKIAIVPLEPGTTPAALDRGQQFRQRASVRADARPKPRRGCAPKSATARRRSTPPRPNWSPRASPPGARTMPGGRC